MDDRERFLNTEICAEDAHALIFMAGNALLARHDQRDHVAPYAGEFIGRLFDGLPVIEAHDSVTDMSMGDVYLEASADMSARYEKESTDTQQNVSDAQEMVESMLSGLYAASTNDLLYTSLDAWEGIHPMDRMMCASEVPADLVYMVEEVMHGNFPEDGTYDLVQQMQQEYIGEVYRGLAFIASGDAKSSGPLPARQVVLDAQKYMNSKYGLSGVHDPRRMIGARSYSARLAEDAIEKVDELIGSAYMKRFISE